MIRKVTLKNFQSHKHSVFEFCPTTNSIIGSSNNGKTVVLRAISWVVTNRPAPDALISHWAKNDKGNQIEEMSVTIETDSHVVERIKTKTANSYIVDGKVLDAVGRNVPQEVQDVLNLTEVNIQKQMDAPFLLSDSPADVARFFNKIVHLDKIDTYISSAESKKRKTKSELDLQITNKAKSEEEIQKYWWTTKAEQIIAKLKELENKYDEYTTKEKKLKQDIQDYITNRNNFEEITYILDRATKISDRIKTTILMYDSMKNDIAYQQETIRKYKLFQKELYTQLIRSAEPLITKLSVLIQNKNDVYQKTSTLQKMFNEYKQNKMVIDSAVDINYATKLVNKLIKYDEKKEELSKEVHKLKESIDLRKSLSIEEINKQIKQLKDSLPPFCPTCGGPIHV